MLLAGLNWADYKGRLLAVYFCTHSGSTGVPIVSDPLALPNARELAGQVAVVTGSSSGIGQAIAA